jgi:peptidoglycan/LPS O-acetylase OafA/YrhL
MKQRAINLPNLTPLRGLAATLVVVFHFDSMVMHLTFSNESMFLRNCYLMVDVFFIISGFIMLHVYGEHFASQVKPSTYLGFLRARMARIYPLHVFTLLIFIVVIYGSLNPYMSGTLTDLIHDPKAIPTHLLLLQSFGFHSIFTWNLPSWSISAEWFSYLLFPFLAFFIAKYRLPGLLVLTVLAAIVYVAIVYYLPRSKEIWSLPNARDINVTYDYGFLRGLAGFMAGLVTYHLFKNKTLVQFLAKDGIALVCIPLFMTLVLCVVANKNRIHKLCRLRPLQLLGEISYSIYMVHYVLILCLAIPVVDALGYDYTGPGSLQPPLYQGFAFCILFLVIVLLVSRMTFNFIEKPWRKRLNNKIKDKMQVAPH